MSWFYSYPPSFQVMFRDPESENDAGARLCIVRDTLSVNSCDNLAVEPVEASPILRTGIFGLLHLSNVAL
jgi:hypothetical protein